MERAAQTLIKPVKVMTMIVALVFAAAPVGAAEEPLRVGHDYWIGYSGVFIADAKGYFEEEGVAVEFTSFSGPGESLPPLVAGHLDLNLTTLHNLGLVAGMTGGPPLELIYLIDSSYGADAIVARPEIENVADLKGKRIAVTLKEANHLFLIVALRQAGLTEDDVSLVNVSPDDAGAAFLSGSVDAAVTWEPWVTRAKKGDGHVIYSTRQATDLIINAIIAPKRTQQARPEDLKAFIRAVDRGVKYLRQHPDKARPIIADRLDAEPSDVKGMLAGDKIYDLSMNRQLLTGAGPSKVQQTMRTILDFLAKRDLITEPVEPTALINTSYLPEAE
jgi:NitT/TauT family transport system substrate-binding protein